jgi:membrane protein implicated in regulation of membrane protease activity
MEEQLIALASSQGIWTTLSFFLIIYILRNQEKRDKKQEEREGNYQNIIESLSERLKLIEDVKDDVAEVKRYIFNERK